MNKFKNLPLYKMDIDENEELDGVTIMSLVDNPAVQKDFLAFGEQEIKFSTDDDKHIITGVCMLADVPIYRNNHKYGEHYVVFTKESVEKIVNKFFKSGNTSNVNLQHKTDVDGVHMFESYIVNKDRGICPSEFSDVPDGSWIGSYKVENSELWNEIKSKNTINGFSVQGFFEYDELDKNSNIVEMNEDDPDVTEEDILNCILDILK